MGPPLLPAGGQRQEPPRGQTGGAQGSRGRADQGSRNGLRCIG
jgi:hypothetical protein